MAETTKHPFGWFAFSDRQAKNPASRDQTLVNPGSSQIPFPVKIFCVFPNPVPLGQIMDPENTIPNPGSTLALNSSSIFLSRFNFVFHSFFILSMAFQASAFLRTFDVTTSILKICCFYALSISSGDMRCEFLIECHEVGLFRLNVQANVSCCLPKIGHEGLPLPCMSQGRCRNLW